MLLNRINIIVIIIVLIPKVVLGINIKPSGGEILSGGEFCEIRWDAEKFNGNVAIDLWDGSAQRWSLIASHIDGKKGTFEWKVPADLTGDRFRVRVSSYGGYSEMSGTYFSIFPVSSSDSGTISSLISGGGTVKAESIPTVGTHTIRARWTDGEPTSITLCDPGGRNIERVTGDFSSSRFIDFNVEDLARGLYFIRVVFRDRHINVGQTIVY